MDKKHFVYVFSKADADDLIARGFILLSHNPTDNCFILAPSDLKATYNLDEENMEHVESDVLRF